MYSKIIIRTGIRAFVHKIIEIIKLFLQSIKCTLYLRKKFDKSEMESIADEDFAKIVIPEFIPSTTVLFISDYTDRRLNKGRILLYRFKVQQECLWLLDHGYTDFIVDYGSNYGIVALSELSKLKEEFKLNLFYGKAMYEHANCITSLDVFKLMAQCHENGVRAIGIHSAYDYIEKVILKVSRISCEIGLIRSNQKLPESIYEHYKQKEQEHNT